MQKFLALAALVVIAFASVEIAAAAPRHGPRAPVFRAHGIFQPVTPRVLSHAGLPTRFHGKVRFRANGLLEPLTPPEPNRHARRRFPQPALIGLPLLAGGPAVIYRDAFWYGPVEAAPRPALLAPATAVGCDREDVTVPGAAGQTMVTITRC